MDAPTISLNTGPVLLGLILLGFILKDALRPHRLIRLRHIWLAPDQVTRIAGYGEPGAPVCIFLDDGTELQLAPRDGEKTEDLRDQVGQAIQQRKNLKG